MGCSPWGHKELDTTERLTHTYTHTHTHTHTVRRNMSKKRTGNNGVVKAKDNSMKEEVVNSIKDHAAKPSA